MDAGEEGKAHAYETSAPEKNNDSDAFDESWPRWTIPDVKKKKNIK